MGVESDRELLELAAKAAGYVVTGLGCMSSGVFVHYSGAQPDDGGDLPNFHWDPLTDDGDALRLAVRLGITVAFWEYPQNSVAAYVSGDGIPASYERHGEDKDAATRRAIVRAAAAIGRAMP